jgi:hypothetical protein
MFMVIIDVKGGKMAVSFCLHCEVNVLMDTVEAVKELSLPGPCGQMMNVSSTLLVTWIKDCSKLHR